MAELSISVDQDQFICTKCLDLLKDPVTLSCGHSFCKVCINNCWDQEDNSGVYRCPQCRDTFTPRPVLCRNNMLAEVVEKIKKIKVQASGDTGPVDVECDFCTGEKNKAVKSCLMCVASFCESHLKPHYEFPVLKKHKLVETSGNVQEKICAEHDRVLEIYCHTDQRLICYLCMMDEHRDHESVPIVLKRAEKQRELKEDHMKFQQRIQEKQKEVENLKQAVDTIKLSAQTAVKDNEIIYAEMISSLEKKCSEVTEQVRVHEEAEVIRAERLLSLMEQEIADLHRRVTKRELKEDHMKFQQRIQEKQKEVEELKLAVDTIKLSAQLSVEDNEIVYAEMISSLEKKRSEMTAQIRAQEKAEVSRAERLLEQLEQEIADLQKRVTEIEELSHTHDHIHFLQNFQSLCICTVHEDSPSITVNQHLTLDGVRKSPIDVKIRPKEFCQEEITTISERVDDVQILIPEPKNRDEFLKYFYDLTLDPNTVNYNLILSENNRVVTYSQRRQLYSDHPERFDCYSQVLCKESMCGRCYWEVEWKNLVGISVSCKDISRKGLGNECGFGRNNQSWILLNSSSFKYTFWHDNIKTDLEGPSFSRIGVYVDHNAGIISFYSISDTMKLLHRVHTTFTQPLYAGFWVGSCRSTMKLCQPN